MFRHPTGKLNFLYQLNRYMYQWLTAVGLGFDLLGALLLAVPDFRWLATKFTFGRLRTVRDAIERSGVSEEHIGFDDLQEIVSNHEPVADVGSSNTEDPMEYRSFAVDALPGMSALWSQGYDDFRWGAEYLQARYSGRNDFEMIDYYQLGPIYRDIRERVEPATARFRSLGLLLLALGFGIQAIAVVLNIVF